MKIFPVKKNLLFVFYTFLSLLSPKIYLAEAHNHIEDTIVVKDHITIKDPWIRESCIDNSAGYMIIENTGNVLDQLIAVESNASEKVELHQIQKVNGVYHMEAVPSIAIPAGTSTILKPGGKHLMFIKLRFPLVTHPDKKVSLRLIFSKAGPIDLLVNVFNPAKFKGRNTQTECCGMKCHENEEKSKP